MHTECRHIKTNGRKCGSPSLQGMPYCYFHTRLHNLAKAPKPAPEEPITLPVLEDSSAIQLALTQILQGLASKNLDPRSAGLCLYALQIATQHVQRNQLIFLDEVVQSVTLSPEGDELAPQKHVCGKNEECEDCPDVNTCEKVVWVKEDGDAGESADIPADADNKNGDASEIEKKDAA
jgi:hypothetical protein